MSGGSKHGSEGTGRQERPEDLGNLGDHSPVMQNMSQILVAKRLSYKLVFPHSVFGSATVF